MTDTAASRADLLSREARIIEFRDGWNEDRLAEVAPALAPSNLDLLCELIRNDIELRWAQRRPVRLDYYRQRYPDAFQTSGGLARLALEDYRRRALAGEHADLREYHTAYGVDVSHWPTPEQIRAEAADCDFAAELFDSSCQPTRHVRVRPLPLNVRTDELRAGPPPEAPHAFPKAGERLLHFELVAELGRGAFARVYLARQEALANRLVALKVASTTSNEPQTLARLQHPNIVPIHSVHQVGPFQLTCMPYLGSITLADVIKHVSCSAPALPTRGEQTLEPLYASVPGIAPPPRLESLSGMSHVEAALDLIAQVADGLAHAHHHGVLHRDLKPANVLLTDEGVPMLLDFNVASPVEADPAQPVSVGGTLPYMAPESLDAMGRRASAPTDVRSDLYALGMMLYELLTGRLPYEPAAGSAVPELTALMTLEQRSRPPRPPSALNPAVTPAVDAIVLKLLQYKPIARYAHAEDLAEDLRRQLAHRPLRFAPNRSLRERWRKWRRRNPRVTAALAVAVLATLLLGAPAGIIVVRQVQQARRNDEIQRAEAILQHHQALADLRTATMLLSARSGDPMLLRQGGALARQVLDRYRVGVDPNWFNRPEIQHLAEEQRLQLRLQIGEALLLLARSEQLHSHGSDRAELAAALHWNQLAEECFPPAHRPRLLARQRDEILAEWHDAPAAPIVIANTDAPTDQYFEGLQLAFDGRHADALLLLLPFTERSPGHFLGWFVRGVCHDALAQWPEADTAFTVCAALEPAFAWTHVNRGLVRLKQRRFSSAEADFTRSLRLKPNWTLAQLNRAIAFEGQSRWREAERDLTAVIERGDAPTRAYFLRSKVRRAAGDAQGAERDRRAGLEREPADALSWTTRGVWRITAEPSLALVDFDRALGLNPNLREAMLNKAIVLADHLHRPADAVNVLDQLLKRYPGDLEARGARGVYLARLGHAERAQNDARLCLDSEPTPFLIYQMAGLYALLSKRDSTGDARAEALRLLARAFRAGFDQFSFIAADHDLDPIRDDPEFSRIVNHARQLHKPIASPPEKSEKPVQSDCVR